MQKIPKALWSEPAFAFLKIIEFEKIIPAAAAQLFLKRMPLFCRSSSEKLLKKGNRTFFLAMKLYLILTLVAITGVYATGLSQHITLKADRMPFKAVIAEIKEQTGYGVLHTENLVQTGKPVTVVAENMPLSEFLDVILKDQPITYRFSEKNILLLPKTKQPPQLNTLVAAAPVFIPVIVKVVDTLGNPLAGATITVNGNKVSGITNTKGEASLDLNENDVLDISYIGYKTRKVKITANIVAARSLTVYLSVDMETSGSLEDLVVIGYATVKKKDLTGAVSSVTSKELKDVTINSAEQALAGRLAGVQVTTSEGSLDADVKIIVRGGASITQDNSPLYIVDGVQVDDGLRSIAPQDIDRIDVLKDASATAIYGSRGANGVVLVTTKSGKSGAATITYSGLVGLNQLPSTIPVMSPYEFVVYQWERTRGTTTDQAMFTRIYKDSTFDGLTRFKDYKAINWQREVMGNNAWQQTHNVALNGGNNSTKYNLSLTYNNTNGVVINTNYKRYLANLKLDQTVTQKLKVGVTMRYSNTKSFGAGTSDPGNAQLNGIRNLVKYKPYLDNGEAVDEFDEDYFDDTNQGGGLGLYNPLAWALAKYRTTAVDQVNIGGYLNYAFSNALSFKSSGGYNSRITDIEQFNDVLRSIGYPSTALYNMTDKSYNLSNVLTYTNNKSKGRFAENNDLTVLLGQEAFVSVGDDLTSQFMNYPRGISAQTALNQFTQGEVRPGYPLRDYDKSTLLSFFGRVNYTFKDNYLFAFTLRADGSSKFAPENRWGYFPSGSFAWRVSKEKFMQDVNWLQDLKFRLTYGTSGNNRVPSYIFSSNFTANSLYGLNNSLTSFGYQTDALANPDLTWETTVSKNIGVDFSILRNRLQVSVDLYSNDTRDVLTSVPISFITGYTTQLQNTADTRNSGVEVQLSSLLVKKKNFTWNADFNISFNKNVVKKLASGLDSYIQNSGWVSLGTGGDFIVEVGQPVGNMYGYVSDGFYKVEDFDYNSETKIYTLKEGVPNSAPMFGVAQPGSVKLKDLSGNGIIDEDDKTVLGNGTPKVFGGLNQMFTVGNFDASLFLNFQFGNDILNANKLEFSNGYLNNNNLPKEMENRWKTIDAQGNVIQRVSGSSVIGEAPEVLLEANKNAQLWMPIRSTPGYYITSWAVEDGSFVRLNNITLGYTVAPSWLSRMKIRKFRIFATANNIAVFTKYSGYDPEVNTRRSTGVTPGVDYSAYPRTRNYVLGVNLTL
ncbi:MAG: TonB-dependent receptor [Niabella sp.]